MVERLKHAIEKARAQREAAPEEAPANRAAPAAAPVTKPQNPAQAAWESLEEISIAEEQLARSRIITREKNDLAYIPFDILRTRLIKVFRDNGWRRVAITSPSQGCGKTLVATNLAFSFARQPDFRTVLFDMDLKAPNVARILGRHDVAPLSWLFTGEAMMESAVKRFGANLALALNSKRVQDSAELIQDERTGQVLTSLADRLQPDAMIFDLPPMLVSDDAIAFLRHVDCVLLVASAGQTTAAEIEQCERMFKDHVNFLGVLLNKAQDDVNKKAYEYS